MISKMVPSRIPKETVLDRGVGKAREFIIAKKKKREEGHHGYLRKWT